MRFSWVFVWELNREICTICDNLLSKNEILLFLHCILTGDENGLCFSKEHESEGYKRNSDYPQMIKCRFVNKKGHHPENILFVNGGIRKVTYIYRTLQNFIPSNIQLRFLHCHTEIVLFFSRNIKHILKQLEKLRSF